MPKKDLRSAAIGDSAAKTKRWTADSFHAIKSDMEFLG